MPKELSTAQAMRYSRHIMLNGFDLDKQEMLINSSVLMIGVGGLGCAAAQYLVASGLGDLTLVDDDVVEASNLQRQVLHREQNVGMLKVSSALASLKAINSEVNIDTIDHRLAESELLSLAKKHDIIVDCSDNLSSRNLLNQVCYQTNTDLVSGAAIRMEGQIFCVSPKRKSACYACISHFFAEQQLSCVESGVMSPLVGIVGAMQALEAIKVLTDYGELALNTLQMFDATTSTWQKFKVNSRQHCSLCGSKD